ncbi:hypothetical protein R6Q59_031031 [Mikania micrantha]
MGSQEPTELRLAEVNYLGQFSHQNLVNLIGYCLEDEHRLLVYEFMPRGSLENHLFRSKSRDGCKKSEDRKDKCAVEKEALESVTNGLSDFC